MSETFEIATSTDGTTIAYERRGSGPVLVIVGGAFNERRSAAPLAELLARDFTTVTVDRRGRGDSGDRSVPPPFTPAREVEDLAAVVDAVGGPVLIYGHSSGGVLVLEAAAAGLPVTRVAVYEPPYGPTDDLGEPQAQWAARIEAAVAADDPALAAEVFLTPQVGAEGVVGMRQAPFWRGLVSVAHTLPYDVALIGDGEVPERLSGIAAPLLVLTGGASDAGARAGTDAVARTVRGAVSQTVGGQDHAIAHEVLAPLLADFFAAPA